MIFKRKWKLLQSGIFILIVSLGIFTFRKFSKPYMTENVIEKNASKDEATKKTHLNPTHNQSIKPLTLKDQELPKETPQPLPSSVEKSEIKTETKKISEHEFKIILNKIEKTLPTKAKLKNLSLESVHHTPELIDEVGEKLGGLAEILSENPSLKIHAIPFYFDCAKNIKGMTSVRALCYLNFKTIKKELNELITDSEEKDISDEIKELSKKLEE